MPAREGAMKPRKNVGVILASGTGERAGFARPKQLVKLAGRPVIAHALERFQAHEGIDEIAIVTSERCMGEIEDLISSNRLSKVACVLQGGAERFESSLAAIRAYEAESQSHDVRLLFHDAVRPLVSHSIISQVLEALEDYDAVDVALSVPDTVILADPTASTITEIADRRLVRLGQTPQGFTYDLIREAYDRALRDPRFTTTDDCGVVVKYMPDAPVYVVEGEPSNMKLTFPNDLMILDKFIQSNSGRKIDALGETIRPARARPGIAIIGGTSGIGAAMAKIASAHGARVSIAGRSTGLDIAKARQWRSGLVSVRGSRARSTPWSTQRRCLTAGR